jgi:hypothetical protein
MRKKGKGLLIRVITVFTVFRLLTTDNTIAKRKTGLKDKKQSTKHTHNTIERVIRPPLKTGVEFPTSIKIFLGIPIGSDVYL